MTLTDGDENALLRADDDAEPRARSARKKSSASILSACDSTAARSHSTFVSNSSLYETAGRLIPAFGTRTTDRQREDVSSGFVPGLARPCVPICLQTPPPNQRQQTVMDGVASK